MARTNAVRVFGVVNVVLAAIHLAGLVLIVCVLIYGVLFSGDPPDEIAAGVLGSLFLLGIFGLGFLAYAVAAVALLKRYRWGYYAHIVASVVAALSCLGIVYTVLGLVFAFNPAFKADLLGETSG